MRPRLPVEFKRVEGKLCYPPFQGSSIILLLHARSDKRLDFAEPLSPYLHAINHVVVTRENLIVEIMISPLPLGEEPNIITDWRLVMERVLKEIIPLKSYASISVEPGEALIYRISLDRPLEHAGEAVTIISRTRSIAGFLPVDNPGEASRLLSIDNNSSYRGSMIYEALIGIATLTIIELDDDGGNNTCPPGHFTLSMLMDALDASKTTVYRLLHDLEEMKYIVHEKGQGWGKCRGYALNLKYEPVIGDLIPAVMGTSSDTLNSLLKLATGMDWTSFNFNSSCSLNFNLKI